MSSLLSDTFNLVSGICGMDVKVRSFLAVLDFKQQISLPALHVAGLLNLLSRTSRYCLFSDVRRIILEAFYWIRSCCLGVGYI